MKFSQMFAMCVGLIGISSSTGAQLKSIEINIAKPVASVQPTMWGVFFEDINLGADGGIYAELVKNRSFEFYKPLMGWAVQQKVFREGAMQVINRQESNSANPRFLQVKVENAAKGDLSITNEGFRGMGIKQGLQYDLSFLYRQPAAGVRMTVQLVDDKNAVIGSLDVKPDASKEWKKFSGTLTANSTIAKAKMAILFEGNGVIDLDMISLFPKDTWKKRPGGLRADMVQLLADMKPGFIRFPGGCIVEGHDLSVRYQWKKTIGPIENRQLIINRWNSEFAHRLTPDYFQTFGLGFFEYFQLAEDIGAEPLPILNCGMACQFNTAELVPMNQLEPYVQDALDLIEFANGDVTTEWGKLRSEMGHPEPFHMKMLGVGNENWGPQYVERLKVFTAAIKAKYPDIKLVNSSGTDPDGDRFNFLNGELRKMNADIIDEHYYRRPEWFLQNASRYDNYDRNGSKIFAGEYAAQSDKTVSVDNKNNLQTAIAEAAFMTGLERNAGVVSMASYAPLFANIDGWQWTPDLIWVDNLKSYGSPNYQVQKLYATNKGTDVVPALLNNQPVAGQDSVYASAVIDRQSKELIVKLVNAAGTDKSISLNVGGGKLASKGNLTVLTGNSLEQMNSFSEPLAISPVTNVVSPKGKRVEIPLKANSMSVFRISYK